VRLQFDKTVGNVITGRVTEALLDMIPAAIEGEDPQWSQARWDEVHAQYS
jgi:hypothetical protein